MLKIGLTGGIGSGKTTVSALFAKRGINIIDADATAHQLSEPGQPGFNAIVDLFGDSVLDSSERVDRAVVRQKIFNDKNLKLELENRLHPLIFASMNEQLGFVQSKYCILSIPLLFETNSQANVDRILVIDCDVTAQINRVKLRDGNNEHLINAIIKEQIPRDSRLNQADDVIINQSSVADLDNQVEKLHNFYLSLSN